MASLLNLYQKLNQKIVEEKKYIQAAAYEELKELLAAKNDLIREIEEKEAAVKSAETKKLQKSDIKKLKELLAEAAEIQQENMEILTQKKGEIKTKLLELYGRKKSIKAYHNRGHQEAKFFDQKS
ncbi:MAG: SMC domain-containing protein [Halanaerobium sp. T82-1]|jgi:molecular chaperone DnaK (HSP70)|nr:MAG: SMC domain-containing protein [Halanaerobium sp. T82-1]